ncbi:hypothetical protein APUTEX25_003290 [Auxenochlorella protothecoides]|uniref:Uncharacterized protein n=1 Tax=Auxenochlorella protothecoides TaxID=3075 RepID=A0A3M7KSG6_AUXPR|nr:hypothetical protein APUTEX25_003290 [Auxenochlorella protothecoides]|eukprot:RMZ53468.1 hypothetical protein APUTEX25_003290 [Auxenochlorella protothecoides]
MEVLDPQLAADPMLASLISPLSIVRQEAYFRISLQIDQGLSLGPPTSTAVLQALTAHHHEIVGSARDALAMAPSSEPSQREVSEPELVSLLSVLQAACLFQPDTQRAACEAGIIQLLLQRLAAATPVLACSCFDTLMSVQHQQPSAFSEFVRQRGVEQVCEVLRHGGDRVRAHAARFLNLLLTHLAPALRGEGVEEDVAASGRSVQSVLGREASAMLHRKVDLADAQAEGKLSQLANALQFFMG